jgi:hypothetical protein
MNDPALAQGLSGVMSVHHDGAATVSRQPASPRHWRHLPFSTSSTWLGLPPPWLPNQLRIRLVEEP